MEVVQQVVVRSWVGCATDGRVRTSSR